MKSRRSVLVVIVASAVTFGVSGCVSSSEDVIPQFESQAKAAGYTCVTTVPPADQVTALRSCRGDNGDTLKFALFDSEDSRVDWYEMIVSGEDPTTVGHSDWVIVGDQRETVNNIARDLGANET